MYRMCLLWFFSGFFTFSVLAANNDSSNSRKDGRPLYKNHGTDTIVTGSWLSETPEHIKDTLRALAFFKYVYSSPLPILQDARINFPTIGFFITERTFISSIKDLDHTRAAAIRVRLQHQPEPPYLLRQIVMSSSERAWHENRGYLGWEHIFFQKGHATVRNLISAHLNQWAVFEVKDYPGPVVELADFTETDKIYFLNLARLDLGKNAPAIIQVTGIKDNRKADRLELINAGGLSVHLQHLFDRGFAVNSEGKIIGFLIWNGDEQRMYLTKVTPELRNMFLENTVEARENNQRKAATGNRNSCLSSLFREF